MTLRVPRHERIEYEGKEHLPAALARDFVCAECGGRIRLNAEREYNVLSCYKDFGHEGFIPCSTWHARWAEEVVAATELEGRHKQELLDALLRLYPTMGEEILEMERRKDAALLHPPEVEI